jgi:hypothetical protein
MLTKLGKRFTARLEGRSHGACHKCGAGFGSTGYTRAHFCLRCGTLYHTYDCGKAMSAALLTNDPADCPKVRRLDLCSHEERLLIISMKRSQVYLTP